MSVGASDEHLGHALREALQRSKIETPPIRHRPIDLKSWDEDLARLFGLKSARSLYPGMRLCSVDWVLNWVGLTPTRNRRGGFFEGFPDSWNRPDVTIPFDVPDAELGAALRLCLSRCL